MKAISLFSGGLDSQLAVALIQKQNIEVIALNFVTPFFGVKESTIKAAQNLKIELITLDISREYIGKVLKNPKYGYGKNMNPCIDCHAFMFKKAGDMMAELGASFIISGEVLGQRPMSQNKTALHIVEKLSGYKGYIVRPLSAKLLPPTIPEENGWIKREELEDISGRSRSRQKELAEKFGITEYPSPAGGCLLTEANFSRRLKKLIEKRPEAEPEEMEILKVGRHFYVKDNLLVIGRNRAENEIIQKIALQSDKLIKVTDRPGPTGIFRSFTGQFNDEDLIQAASILARYSDAKNEPETNVKIYNKDGDIEKIFIVKPLTPEEIPEMV
ncbi:tRNA 4-thiouridine(8) synthase ThiI [Thermosyntropha sp.]|uniref:tRNA 4-thiouridine(8) synthase ThiI n=1 Tax=Thermosyntropha sp. TaxID=2740820 RepID=UPI0025E22A5A|nr:tRNA 4-thiouridine(8) synthase ThiI [Thermosyntropha sp.]MBO8158429.1 tRNA 4-thiouridine(8) synthase ThiI [Thermosyntropha sp.]